MRVAGQRLVEDLHAVRIRQAEVNDEPVIGKCLEPFERVGCVDRLGRRKSVGFERLDNGLAEIDVIFDNQNGWLDALAHIVGRQQTGGSCRKSDMDGNAQSSFS